MNIQEKQAILLSTFYYLNSQSTDKGWHVKERKINSFCFTKKKKEKNKTSIAINLSRSLFHQKSIVRINSPKIGPENTNYIIISVAQPNKPLNHDNFLQFTQSKHLFSTRSSSACAFDIVKKRKKLQ